MHSQAVITTSPVFLSLPYSLDLLCSTPEDARTPYYEMMELGNISDFQHMMTTTSDEDIPDPDYISRL